MRSRGEIGAEADQHLADFRLNAADGHLQLLHLSGRRGGEFLVHLAHVVRDDTSQEGSTLAFGAVLEHLFFGCGERDADTTQRCGLSLQRLAEKVTHRHRVFLRGIDALLLCEEVIHRRHEGAECRRLRGERADLLRAGHLHRATHHAELLLRRNHVFHALHIFGSRVHALLHDGF